LTKTLWKPTRRRLLQSSAALAAGTAFPLVHVRRGLAADLPDPAEVLAKINVGNYVKPQYREQYQLGDDDLLWDPAKDWIRTADWEAVRKEFAGTTVRFAIGAADVDSAKDGGRDPGRFALRQGRGGVHLRPGELRRAAVFLALAR
jgi:multiple sugar transport system substrate-binding protein